MNEINKVNKKNISVYITVKTLKKLDKLIEGYIFPNRSALVNYCVEFALPNIIKEFEKIKKSIEINDIQDVLGFLKNHGFIIHSHSQGKRKVPLGNVHFNSNNNKE